MKQIYCAESQDRIPPEYFKQGKAVWSGGFPYLKVHADKLKLKLDAAPPTEFAWVMSDNPVPPPSKTDTPSVKPPKPPEQKSTLDIPTIVCVSDQIDPAMSNKIKETTGGASSTIHGETKPMKDPLTASTLRPTEKKENVAAVSKNPEPAPKSAAADVATPQTPQAQAEVKPAEKVEAKTQAKPEPPAAAKAVTPATPSTPVAPADAAAKPAIPTTQAATAAKPAVVAPVTAAKPAVAVPAVAAKPAVAAPTAGAAPVKKEPARVLAEASLGYGEPIPVADLTKLPIFEGIPVNQIERLPGAIVKRVFKPGEIVCTEGQYGSTAFYIVSGTADVYIDAPINHVKSNKKEKGGFLGVIRKFTTSLAGRKEDPREGESRAQYIPNDGPMDLPMNNPVAEMKPGDLFGEMSCMSFYPRSATVRAKTECVMYEMLRNMLTLLQKNKKFKEQVDKNYRERALGQHLRSVPILKDYVDDNVIDQLRNRVDLVEFDPGETIIKQGDPSDAFYLVRVGCVKVSQTHPGGEIVLTYLGRGEYFGEIGLLKNTPRTATCTALDHCEVVKVKKADFDFILSTYEELNAKLQKAADARMKASEHMSQHAPAMPLDDFLSQGLMGAQNLLLLDLEKCTRCDECVRACADSHQGVTRLVREGLRFDKFLVPTSCRSCMDPVCMIGCPVGSIRRKDSMEILIEDWCIGCEVCAKQCPYGNISMHSFDVQIADAEHPGKKKADTKEKAVTCDLCTDLKEPSCVYACPHDAAHRVNAREYFMAGMGDIK